MGLAVKRILSLHEKSGLSEAQLFNRLVDLAGQDGVDCVMADLPPEYLTRFRDWIDHLPSLDTLLNPKAGPISEREKVTIRAIRKWLDCYPGGREAREEAGSAANGSGDTDPSLPIGSRD
jgi:hypothetical protein